MQPLLNKAVDVKAMPVSCLKYIQKVWTAVMCLRSSQSARNIVGQLNRSQLEMIVNKDDAY